MYVYIQRTSSSRNEIQCLLRIDTEVNEKLNDVPHGFTQVGGAKREREGGEDSLSVKEWAGFAAGIEVHLCTVAKSCVVCVAMRERQIQ